MSTTAAVVLTIVVRPSCHTDAGCVSCPTDGGPQVATATIIV